MAKRRYDEWYGDEAAPMSHEQDFVLFYIEAVFPRYFPDVKFTAKGWRHFTYKGREYFHLGGVVPFRLLYADGEKMEKPITILDLLSEIEGIEKDELRRQFAEKGERLYTF